MIRPARVDDADAIYELIATFAGRGLMLFRSMAELYEKIRQFVVWEDDGKVLGCCALEVVWRDLAEVKCLAVQAAAQRRGIGRLLVEAVQEDAVRLGLDRLFALTREPHFFERLGFEVVPRESLPHKVWSDCINCDRRRNCDEIAMCKPLTEAGRTQQEEAVRRTAGMDPFLFPGV